MAAFDPKEHLVAITRHQMKRMVNDLKAISGDQQNVSSGGSCRAPLHYVAECGSMNGLIAQYLTTGDISEQLRTSPEVRERYLASFDTEDKAIAHLTEQTERLIQAIEQVDAEKLGDKTDALFGRPMSLYAIAELPAMHMSYHDGQLNLVHRLCGDNQVHW